jgi:hypothetical protein
MLTIWGNKSYRHCDGISRRDFLKIGTLGAAGLTFADLLRLKAEGKALGHKAVIMIYLPGGPSHIDTYDPKPDAPSEMRGPFKPIPTNVTGIQICEKLSETAKIADKLAIVRTVKFAGPHECHELVTGVSFRERVKRPAFGSIVSRLHGPREGLPHYVGLGYWTTGGSSVNEPEQPGYAGAAHRPFRPGGTSKGAGALESLNLPAGVSTERLASRKALLQSMDDLRREMDDRNGSLASVDRFTAQALDMISSPKARDAFDISKEPASVRQKYGRLENLLRARRLVEAGVSVVTTPLTGTIWDQHNDIYVPTGLPAQLPVLDRGVYALVSDLHERGLAQDVSVVVWGEFGRSPRLFADNPSRTVGRDHWAENGFAILAGGGMKTGQIVGETDVRGERAKGNPYTPRNVLATLYLRMGINPANKIPNHNGRPTPLLDDQQPIAPLM